MQLRPLFRRASRDAILVGAAFVVVHSYFAAGMFRAIYADRDEPQAVVAWIGFDEFDSPAVPLAREWLGQTRLMKFIFDRGYDLVGSGPNLRAFVLVGLAGGLQWFVIGCGIGACLSAIQGAMQGICSRIFRSRLPEEPGPV